MRCCKRSSRSGTHVSRRTNRNHTLHARMSTYSSPFWPKAPGAPIVGSAVIVWPEAKAERVNTLIRKARRGGRVQVPSRSERPAKSQCNPAPQLILLYYWTNQSVDSTQVHFWHFCSAIISNSHQKQSNPQTADVLAAMACSTGAAYPALRLLWRRHASGRGPSLAYSYGLLASSSRLTRRPTSRPSCLLCSAPLPPWQVQARRGAHMRPGGRPNRPPTVRIAERQQQLGRPRGLDDGRPAANWVFPADPSTLIGPLETAIDVLSSELTATDCLDIIAMCRQVYVGKTVSEAVLKQGEREREALLRFFSG